MHSGVIVRRSLAAYLKLLWRPTVVAGPLCLSLLVGWYSGESHNTMYAAGPVTFAPILAFLTWTTIPVSFILIIASSIVTPALERERLMLLRAHHVGNAWLAKLGAVFIFAIGYALIFLLGSSTIIMLLYPSVFRPDPLTLFACFISLLSALMSSAMVLMAAAHFFRLQQQSTVFAVTFLTLYIGGLIIDRSPHISRFLPPLIGFNVMLPSSSHSYSLSGLGIGSLGIGILFAGLAIDFWAYYVEDH